ncbi:MAG: HEAT repeat domain-containing protein [Bacteroidota bacterium]
MAFYDLHPNERHQLVARISNEILAELKSGSQGQTLLYFSDPDTYIRKSAYLSYGRLFSRNNSLRPEMVQLLEEFLGHEDFKVRQTAINAAGEIGKTDFRLVHHIFDTGLFDRHHSPRNAVIGSIKKMGEVNPLPVLSWAKEYLHHPDKEIRREICHGVELRGRKYPQDILPLLKELQFDETKRVRSTLVHVIGQIAYKEGCLQTVVENLKSWENRELVRDALEEIIDVHYRYRNFSVLTQEQARAYIAAHF